MRKLAAIPNCTHLRPMGQMLEGPPHLLTLSEREFYRPMLADCGSLSPCTTPALSVYTGNCLTL